MRILAVERELTPPGAAMPPDLLRQEAVDVWTLQKQGVIRDIWFTTQDRHAVIMLECANGAEARQRLAALPLARSGLIDFMVYELSSYDGYERLFSTGGAVPPPKHEEPPEY
ncbi:MAG: superoxide dismutase [Opitutae bacterium]|nr:superoxide dismutase [Opitutae bacterium]